MSSGSKKVDVASLRATLDDQRSKNAIRQRRLVRSLQAVRRLLKSDWNGVNDLRARLVLTSRALEYFVVDEAMAVSYIKVRLASQDPRVDQDLRQHLKELQRTAFREIQGYVKFEYPRGRRPQLARREEEHVCGAYFALLHFFQDPKNRPTPEQPEDQRLLADINRQLPPFAPRRPIQPSEFELLSEEIDRNRLAKLAVAFAFAARPGTIEKIIARRRPGTPQEFPASDQ